MSRGGLQLRVKRRLDAEIVLLLGVSTVPGAAAMAPAPSGMCGGLQARRVGHLSTPRPRVLDSGGCQPRWKRPLPVSPAQERVARLGLLRLERTKLVRGPTTAAKTSPDCKVRKQESLHSPRNHWK